MSGEFQDPISGFLKLPKNACPQSAKCSFCRGSAKCPCGDCNKPCYACDGAGYTCKPKGPGHHDSSCYCTNCGGSGHLSNIDKLTHLRHCYQGDYECKYNENDCPAKPVTTVPGKLCPCGFGVLHSDGCTISCDWSHQICLRKIAEIRIDELECVDAVEVLNAYRGAAKGHLAGDPYLRGYYDALREVSNNIKARITDLNKKLPQE